MKVYNNITEVFGNTPLVRLNKITDGGQADVYAKLEFYNPSSSVKDRLGIAMVNAAEASGELKPGGTLIEATSGNTGIALAMAAAIRGYRMVLIMPDNLSLERRQSMKAYGAELILVTQKQGMEGARDLALEMEAQGQGKVLNQFANDDNWLAHYETTGPEIWRDTAGRVTHFVSAMGTTGTITGVSRYLKERNAGIQIIGAQPADGSSIPGIRKWAPAYVPPIREKAFIDQIEEVTQADAEDMARRLATVEGLFCGPSAAGAALIALRVAAQLENATVVFIVCDRGDRYLSMGIFPG